MQRRGESGRSVKGRRTNRPKARKGVAARVSAADLKEQVSVLTRELKEAREQQTATSEVLRVISSSPNELEPVFRTMLNNATHLCGAEFGALNLYDGEKFRNAALCNAPAGFQERLGETWHPHPKSGLARVTATKQVVHIDDIRTQPPYLESDPAVVALSDVAGARTLLLVPMLKDDELIGAIAIYRQEVHPFTDKQIELVKNFAAQAVIAIENARLLSELRESLERQTATSDVLQVISSSPGELEPVFDTLLANATKLCEASYGAMWLRDGVVVRNVAFHGELPEAFHELWHAGSVIPADAEVPVARCMQLGKPIHVEDLREDNSYHDNNPLARGAVDLAGIRTLVAVPLLKEGGIGRSATPISGRQVTALLRRWTNIWLALCRNLAAARSSGVR
jgi:GAF domain